MSTNGKRGRPLGSKDKPRPAGAPPRGRPKKDALVAHQNASGSVAGQDLDEYAHIFDNDPLTDEILWDLDQLEQQHQVSETRKLSENATEQCPRSQGLAKKQLEEAAKLFQIRPFFTTKDLLDPDSDEDDDDIDEGGEDAAGEVLHGIEDRSMLGSGMAWFKQPKYMPDWLYKYFGKVVYPLITEKDGRRLLPPRSFRDNPTWSASTLWILPQDPMFSLSRHQFDPPTFYRPRVFLWLPHFFVQVLYCPKCKSKVLEKNGPLPPRRIVDLEDNFYIVTWAYYCRNGCRSHYAGWNQKLTDSLPPYLRLAFPALLSRRSGLSHSVVTQLRVSNQHKMGPRGVRSLLWEMHTLQFNRLQLQYLEAVFESVVGREQDMKTQHTLHAFIGDKIPDFGDFGDPGRYAGFVPSEYYLSEMMNKAIERDEADANQHTACLPVDQIAIDGSHKVNKHIAKVDGVPVFGALWTCMDSRYIRAQSLTLTKAHDERLGPLKGIANSLELYGYDSPSIAFSDDPVKDKALLHAAFPTLGQNLTPIASAHGLNELRLPENPVDLDKKAVLVISMDAEWNISRQTGVSILQITSHSHPNEIYIIPVHKFGAQLHFSAS